MGLLFAACSDSQIPEATASDPIVSPEQLSLDNRDLTVRIVTLGPSDYETQQQKGVLDLRFAEVCQNADRYPPALGAWLPVRYASTNPGELYGPTQCALEPTVTLVASGVLD